MKYPVKADSEEIKKGDFEPIPAGNYCLQCVEFKEKVSKSLRPLISVAFQVSDHGHYFGRRVWYNLTIIPAGDDGHRIMVNFLKQMGQPYHGDIEVNPEKFVGETIKAFVVIEEYKGKKRNVIKQIQSIREERESEVSKVSDTDSIPF